MTFCVVLRVTWNRSLSAKGNSPRNVMKNEKISILKSIEPSEDGAQTNRIE